MTPFPFGFLLFGDSIIPEKRGGHCFLLQKTLKPPEKQHFEIYFIEIDLH